MLHQPTSTTKVGSSQEACAVRREDSTGTYLHITLIHGSRGTSSREERVCCAAEDVEGSWELVFSTQLKSGYMPIRELVGFYPSREEASIDANAGPLPIGG